MNTQESILSIDPGPDDCLYRILRKDEHQRRVVYVMLEYLDLMPELSRICRPEALSRLSKVVGWTDNWKTLTISKDDAGIRAQPNLFEPHALPREQLQPLRRLFNVLDLEIVEWTTNRVFRVRENGRQCFLKLARFEYEVAATAREVKVYDALMSRGSTLTPRILGYAYEESPDRVIGFVYEEISGHHPTIKDLGPCKEALQQLHQLGLVHGDINKYNIFMTDDGVKFIDFEASEMGLGDRAKEEAELEALEGQLLDESGNGRGWHVVE